MLSLVPTGKKTIFAVEAEDGDLVGQVQMHFKKPHTVMVSRISLWGPRKYITISSIRGDLAREIKRLFPTAEEVEGFRITGTRAKGGRINIPRGQDMPERLRFRRRLPNRE